MLQVVAFTGLMLFVLPAIVIEGSGSAWLNPMERPAWQLSLIAQVLAFPALLGLSAVQEFVTRGGGTPVPFDPPQRLVTSGLYAYIRNPMQLSAVVLLFLLGLVLRNPWVSAAGVMAHVYSVGLAGWDEGEDLRERFGERWIAYRSGVRAWVPRFRPWHPAGALSARLFVAESCGMCRDVGRWFEQARRAAARDCSGRIASLARADADYLRAGRRYPPLPPESKRWPARWSISISGGRSSGACCACPAFPGLRSS